MSNDGTQTSLIDMGVRVFPEGVDNYGSTKQKSKNQDRRVARGQRRQTIRRKRRKLKLRQALTSLGLLDVNSTDWATALLVSPYQLRADALTRKLTPAELSRVFLHLAKRRGFLSNRKTDRAKSSDKDAKGMLGEISELQTKLTASGQTLGQYLAAIEAKPGTVPHPDSHKVRSRHTQRSMYFDEFKAIWACQSQFYPTLLTDQTRWGTTGPRPALQPHKPRAIKHGVDWLTAYGIEGIIFFQRPMFWPTEMIGRCEYEPREYRCPKADRAFQLFRILCDVNNLRYFHPLTRDSTALTQQQRTDIVAELCRRDRCTFDQLRKAAGLDTNCRFTIETAKKKALGGHKTDAAMRAASNAAGIDYDALADDKKDSIVRLISDPRIDDFKLRQDLSLLLSITDEQAGVLAAAALSDGYGNLSLVAINRLLPHLRAGKTLMQQNASDSALHAAGYLRPDQRSVTLVTELPSLSTVFTGPLANITNPVVTAALHEVRKVVNLLVKTYGRPDRVHIELARDMKMNAERKRELENANAEREEKRSQAADAIRALGVKPTRDAIDRYLLWQEQDQRCIYSDEIIGITQLLGGEVDIDHLLPWSLSLDDSRMNKVVCFRRLNQEKGQRTVHQWLAAADPARYQKVLQAGRNLPYSKREKLKVEKVVLDDFIQRQLVDTGYITRLATTYLAMMVSQQNVLGGKGKYTSELRWQWGLDTVLSDIPDSPAWQEVRAKADKLESDAATARSEGRTEDADQLEKEARHLIEHGLGEKNRADHRHHAIDALVIALTDQRRLQALSRIHKQGGTSTTGEILESPWPDFRKSVLDKVATVNVSHRVQRKVAGPLHEETQYAVARQVDAELADEGGLFAVRKPVTSLTDAEIPRIRDRRIRELVQTALGLTGGRAKKGAAKVKPTKDQKLQRDTVLANLQWPNGLPIKSVRVTKPEKTIQPIRNNTQTVYVKPGSTHHLCIFESVVDGKVERDAVFVTTLEAAQRIQNRQDVIQRIHPTKPDARFLMSLSQGELVLLNHQGKAALCTYKTSASTTGQLRFALHSDARRSVDGPEGFRKLTATFNTLQGEKVTVDPIGRVRRAND